MFIISHINWDEFVGNCLCFCYNCRHARSVNMLLPSDVYKEMLNITDICT